jgi:hypothetical protein
VFEGRGKKNIEKYKYQETNIRKLKGKTEKQSIFKNCPSTYDK